MGLIDPLTTATTAASVARMETDARRAVQALAATRHGVISTREARELGLSTSQIRTDVARGLWHRAAPGVLVAAAAPASWHQRVAVAVLSTGGVASHRTAARLHGFDGQTDSVVEVSVPHGTRRDRPSWVVHRTQRLEHIDIVVVQGIRSTGIARTLVDLGAVVEDDLVEQALDGVLRCDVSERWIRQTLDRVERPGPSGSSALRRVLEREDRRGAVPDSMFERLVERAATAAGLPQPERQVRVHDDAGRLVAVLDAAWPDRRIGSEAQSERWHGGPRGAQRDLDRHNRLTAMGWRMLYATWADVRSPASYTTQLRELHANTPPAP